MRGNLWRGEMFKKYLKEEEYLKKNFLKRESVKNARSREKISTVHTTSDVEL